MSGQQEQKGKGQNQQNQEQDLNRVRQVRREKLAELQAAGKDPFVITTYDQTHHSEEVAALYAAHEQELLGGRTKPDTEGMDEAAAREVLKADYNERRAIMDASPIHVSVAGRIMLKRVMGKASFCHVQDRDGKIQVYVSKDGIGEDAYAEFKKMDIGDIIGVKGYAFRTMTGEVSIHAEELVLLTKSLQILPEKFHGITDVDTRYRQRYIDLIMNPEVKDTFRKRSQIIKEIRKFLDGRDFIEVFKKEAAALGKLDYFAQGTIYPDVIESGQGTNAAVIKSHHNVGGLPKELGFTELIEPLRMLFKDEVRALGETLGLPRELVWRQPFPGPGLAIRIIGEVTPEKAEIVRESDAIFREEIAAAGLDRHVNQYFTVLTGIQSVGVMGDERTYDYTVALRAVTTDDFMTADWARLPYDLIARVSARIVNEVPHASRVVFDVTTKPPASIEWE